MKWLCMKYQKKKGCEETAKDTWMTGNRESVDWEKLGRVKARMSE